jgi:hypothetical protein
MVFGGAAIAIALGVQGDKYRKEFRSQANLYRPAFEKLADNLGPALEPILTQTGGLIKWGKVALCATTFGQAAFGVATCVNVYTGIKAQQELSRFYQKLGHDIEAIKEALEAINANVGVLVAHQNQDRFGKHVYDYVKMRRNQLAASPDKHLLFVYHQGTEWHPSFEELNTAAPVAQLCGIFSDLDVMAAFMQVIRKIVGPKPTFHILIPATELYTVPNKITWPKEVHPMVFEGEKGNGNGLPYVYYNMPNASPDMFFHVKNLADEKVIEAPPKPSIWRKVASTSAAWGVGLPAAVIATPGGLIVGLVGCAALAPVAASGAVLGGVICGTGLAAGAAAGTITGLFVGKQVENKWDKDQGISEKV